MGWVLTMNQFPFSIHFAVTHNNFSKFETSFIPDLTKAIELARKAPKN